MNYILKKLSLGILALSFTFSFAQSINPKAKSILDAVSANYKSHQNNSFAFIYGIGMNKITKNESGYFYSSGEKYSLKIGNTEQIFDGNKVYNINSEDHEVTIAKPTKDDVLFSPFGYLEAYKEGYNLVYVGKKDIHGVSTDHIRLTPTTNNGMKYVNLFVDSGKKELLKLEQYGTDGSISLILVKSYAPGASIDSSKFQFDPSKYGKYLITEL